MNGGSDTYTPYHFLKKGNDNFQMCICKVLFNRLAFLPEISTKLEKCPFLDNLRTITQEGNMKTRQTTSFFSSAFSALTVCKIRFCI